MTIFSFNSKKRSPSARPIPQGVKETEHKQFPLAGIVLAAGRGSRFDPSGKQSKLLQAIDGIPMLAMTVSTLNEVLDDIVVVLRDDDHRYALEQVAQSFGAKTVTCPDASSGMGHSLAWGVSYVNAHFDCVGALISLGDMPYVRTQTIASLAKHIRKPSDLAALRFAGRIGHPVGFGSDYFGQLGALTGDQGAKRMLDQYNTVMVDTLDPGVLRDIDRPADIYLG